MRCSSAIDARCAMPRATRSCTSENGLLPFGIAVPSGTRRSLATIAGEAIALACPVDAEQRHDAACRSCWRRTGAASRRVQTVQQGAHGVARQRSSWRSVFPRRAELMPRRDRHVRRPRPGAQRVVASQPSIWVVTWHRRSSSTGVSNDASSSLAHAASDAAIAPPAWPHASSLIALERERQLLVDPGQQRGSFRRTRRSSRAQRHHRESTCRPRTQRRRYDCAHARRIDTERVQGNDDTFTISVPASRWRPATRPGISSAAHVPSRVRKPGVRGEAEHAVHCVAAETSRHRRTARRGGSAPCIARDQGVRVERSGRGRARPRAALRCAARRTRSVTSRVEDEAVEACVGAGGLADGLDETPAAVAGGGSGTRRHRSLPPARCRARTVR